MYAILEMEIFAVRGCSNYIYQQKGISNQYNPSHRTNKTCWPRNMSWQNHG